MEEWDDSLIIACYEKAVSEHETRGKTGEEGKRSKKRKEMTGSVLQPNIGEPGPWQTFNKAEDDIWRREKAHALYIENEELNAPLHNSNSLGTDAPSSSSTWYPAHSANGDGHYSGSYLGVQMDEALHSMMMSW